MGKGTVKLARRGLPSDRPLSPLTSRGDKLESWVELKGSGYDKRFSAHGTPPESGKQHSNKGNGSW